MFGWSKNRRRQRLRAEPFSAHWLDVIERNLPYYLLLGSEDQRELLEHVRVFLAEKNFEGCKGFALTDEVRVTIAAHACVLLLHRDTDYYPRLVSILVYPHAFVSEITTKGPGRTVIKGEETRVGESWQYGVVIFAWDDVEFSIAHPHDGHNVILHEFAHQLDAENGASDGFPLVEDEDLADEWSEAFTNAYDQFLDELDAGHESVIDAYGAENPSEFFAVVTETFFELPAELREEYPELYEALKRYFRQDPVALMQNDRTDPTDPTDLHDA